MLCNSDCRGSQVLGQSLGGHICYPVDFLYLVPEQLTLENDALTMDWMEPIIVVQQLCRLTMTASVSTTLQLLSLLVDEPVCLLLLPNVFHLHTWKLSGNLCEAESFHKRLKVSSPQHSTIPQTINVTDMLGFVDRLNGISIPCLQLSLPWSKKVIMWLFSPH